MKKYKKNIGFRRCTRGICCDGNYKKGDNEYRKLIINNYVAIYRVDKDNKKVYIVRMVYGGRNYLNEK